MFLVSQNLFRKVLPCKMLASYWTDLYSVALTLSESNPGRALLKFNDSFLDNPDYISGVITCRQTALAVDSTTV